MAETLDDGGARLTSGNWTSRNDPYELFASWLAEATGSEPNDPNAVALATVDPSGLPDVRMVLLKGFDRQGFTFYTNLGSSKARQLAATPKAALCFHWKTQRRQVRVRGPVGTVTAEEADIYYASRARGSRIGAWASRQSEPLESRAVLEKAVADWTAKYGDGEIPRPAHWSGFRIEPVQIEFWQDGQFRLHDRLEFRRSAGEGWTSRILYP